MKRLLGLLGLLAWTVASAQLEKPTRLIRGGTTLPAACRPNIEIYVDTDAAPAGQQVYLCNAAGNGWNLIGDGGAGGSTHTILSATHTDTTAASVVRGDLMAGIGATPKWQRVGIGATGTVLHGGTEPSYSAVSLTADVSGILPGANGGTNSQFTQFTGPTTSLKTFTLPDASATLEWQANKAAANGYASLDSGTRVPTAQLGSGTADATTFLRGDQTWATPAGGSGDSIRVEDGDNAGTFTAMSDADFDDSGDINFTRTAGPPDVLTATVRADAVALPGDTTGNYLASCTNGTGITGCPAAGENAAATPAFDFSDAGADPALNAEECRFSNEGASDGGWVCEGAADTIETRFRVTSATTSDKVITFPDGTGTVSLLGPTIEDAELASNYSGIGACGAGAAATTLNDNAAPTCSATVVFTDEASTWASAGTQVFQDPVDILPDATNGVTVSAAGLLAKTGTGSVRADDVVCGSACVADAELVNNYSGTGSCTNQVVTAVNDAAAPTCGNVTSAMIPTDEIVAADVASSLDTRKCAHLYVTNVAVTDEFVIRLPPFTGTMTRIDCEAFSGTSFTINICDGEDIGDDTCTTSIPGGTMVCDTTGVNDTTLTNPGFVARDKVSLVVTAVTGTVNGDVYITCTVD